VLISFYREVFVIVLCTSEFFISMQVKFFVMNEIYCSCQLAK